MTRSGYGPGEARGAAGTNRCGRVGRSASGIGGMRRHRGPGAVLGCRCKKGTECPERAPRRAKKLLKGQKTGVREWLRETGPFGLEEGRLKGDLVALQLPERRLQRGGGR